MRPKILFILRRREDYSPIAHSPKGLSTGLYNSAKFMDDMLNDLGIESNLEVAIDANCIDRLVSHYRPNHVIIEALWVPPSKFRELTKLHPSVKWIVRLHSELPFLAGEGMAFDWLGDYVTYPQVNIGVNAPRMMREVAEYLKIKQVWASEECKNRIIYLPNYYPQNYQTKEFDTEKYWIDIACFGAIRPLKNHMVQALASLKFANIIKKQLRFHINGGRIEMNGNPVLNNLKAMFEQLYDQGHELIIHEWTPREEFLNICSTMDIGLQCNFSETFNIVSADLISQGVPIVGSYEIPWASSLFNARPAESDEICNIIMRTYHHPAINVWLNQKNLTKYTNKTKQIWNRYFREI